MRCLRVAVVHCHYVRTGEYRNPGVAQALRGGTPKHFNLGVRGLLPLAVPLLHVAHVPGEHYPCLSFSLSDSDLSLSS